MRTEKKNIHVQILTLLQSLQKKSVHFPPKWQKYLISKLIIKVFAENLHLYLFFRC